MEPIIKQIDNEDEMMGKGYVHWKTFQETYKGMLDDQYLKRLTMDQCIALAKYWPINTFIAKNKNAVLGFGTYGKYRAEDINAGEIYSLYVLKDFHKQKVGYNLMNTCMEALEKYQTIYLWVIEANQQAIDFFKQYGFKEDGKKEEINLGSPVTQIRMVFKR